MIDKEKLIAEIRKRIDNVGSLTYTMCAEYNRVWAYNDVLQILEFMPDEPVIEGTVEFVSPNKSRIVTAPSREFNECIGDYKYLTILKDRDGTSN